MRYRKEALHFLFNIDVAKLVLHINEFIDIWYKLVSVQCKLTITQLMCSDALGCDAWWCCDCCQSFNMCDLCDHTRSRSWVTTQLSVDIITICHTHTLQNIRFYDFISTSTSVFYSASLPLLSQNPSILLYSFLKSCDV